MTKVARLHANWLNDPAYKAAFDALEAEFAEAAAVLTGRAPANSDPIKFVIYRTPNGEFAWAIVSETEKLIANVPGFGTREDAEESIRQFRHDLSRAKVTDVVA